MKNSSIKALFRLIPEGSDLSTDASDIYILALLEEGSSVQNMNNCLCCGSGTSTMVLHLEERGVHLFPSPGVISNLYEGRPFPDFEMQLARLLQRYFELTSELPEPVLAHNIKELDRLVTQGHSEDLIQKWSKLTNLPLTKQHLENAKVAREENEAKKRNRQIEDRTNAINSGDLRGAHRISKELEMPLTDNELETMSKSKNLL